jgi:NAD(P)-dependent dehydrogenase (short-subunit alcohol dehydrogenase family)
MSDNSKVNHFIELNGKTALLTGAAGYLGREFALTLTELGADLILTDINSQKLIELQNDIHNSYGRSPQVIVCNLSNNLERHEFLQQVNSSFTKIDILINNAAYTGASNLAGWNASFEHQSVSAFESALDLNLTSVFEITRGLVDQLKRSGNGSIINIASIYGLYAPDYSLYADTDMHNPAGYAVSKAGVIQFTKWLAATLGPTIRANSISPGGIYRDQNQDFVARYSNKTALKRMAKEQDISGVLAFLASDMSGYMTGQNLIVDGGWGI